MVLISKLIQQLFSFSCLALSHLYLLKLMKGFSQSLTNFFVIHSCAYLWLNKPFSQQLTIACRQ